VTVVASVHVSDLTLAGTIRAVLRTPSKIRGLRHADIGLAAPLRDSGSLAPSLRRVGMIAFWEADEALEEFEQEHRLGRQLSAGWTARLEPLRAFGTWPGLPRDVSASRSTEYTGPAVVLTLARTRPSRVRSFLRTSKPAETAAMAAPGMIWGTALARPPFVATVSLWASVTALSQYAYGRDDGSHPQAIRADRQRPFHKSSSFIRFRPYAVSGHLVGRNPLTDTAFTAAEPHPERTN
jgi:hypothetical protein